MKKEKRKPFGLLRNIIFTLNVLIALMIIVGAGVLAETDFGKSALLFGFVMLGISTVLRIIQQW